MSVGVLIVTHEGVGEALMETAVGMLGFCPLAAAVLPVSRDCDPDLLDERARALCERLDEGHGILVLTDIYGSTPANVACRLRRRGRVEVIAGVNLPMMVRVFNYATLTLPELVEKALGGGREGIMVCEPPAP